MIIPPENESRPAVTCVNHPERAAVERCEVCNRPLCAYCLYYTADGQRLCVDHAREAQSAGATVHSPGTYSEGLIRSQIAAARPIPERDPQFVGDTIDLLALIGLILGIVSISLCIPIGICLIGPAGVLVSVVALIGSKNARDPQRTRSMAAIGVTLSSVWLVVILGCIFSLTTNTMGFSRAIGPINSGGMIQITVVAPISQPGFQNPAATSTPIPQATTVPSPTARR